MAENTKIEWCDHTVNFWWGCTKVSPACEHCYAEAQDARFYTGQLDFQHGKEVRQVPHWGPDAPRLLRVVAATREAMRYERRAVKDGRRFRVFTNSMSDFFEDRRDLDGARVEALDVMRLTPHLDWLILTKRPARILDLLRRAEMDAPGAALSDWLRAWLCMGLDRPVPPANVWLGTTVENQAAADQRIPALLQVPARVRFLSCEPLLGPIDIRHRLGGLVWTERDQFDTTRGIDWIICGGESGTKARPMHPDWARSLRDQCAVADVPFLFKQWGEYLPAKIVGHLGFTSDADPIGGNYEFSDQTYRAHFGHSVPLNARWVDLDKTTRAFQIGKKNTGRLLDGVEHNGCPEVKV